MAGAAIPYGRLASFYFFYFALLGAWLPFWPLYLQDIGYGAAAIGALSGILQGTKVVAPTLWGYLAHRTGRRMRVIRGGALAALLVFCGVFLRTDFFWLVMVVAGYSFFWNAVLAQFEAVTLSHLQEDYRRYSLIRLWGSIGFIVAVAGLGGLFDFVSVRYLPFILSALLAGIWIASLSVDERPAPSHQQRTARGELGAILRRPPVLAFFFVCFLLQVAHGPYYTFFSVFLEQHGYQRTHTGLLWALGVGAEVALFMLMPKLFDRFSLRAILLVSLLLTALRWLLIAYFVEQLPVLLFAQCLHAAPFACCHAVAVEYVRRTFSGGSEGMGLALYGSLCFGGGAALGAILSGLLWTVGEVATFGMGALVSLLALAIAWRFVHAPADQAAVRS